MAKQQSGTSKGVRTPVQGKPGATPPAKKGSTGVKAKTPAKKSTGAKKTPAKSQATTKKAASKRPGTTPKPKEKTSKSYIFDLEAALQALPAEAAENAPDVPVAAEVQEARDLVSAAARYEKELRALPFDHALLDSLPARIQALQDAESVRRSVRGRKLPKELKTLEAEAQTLRSEMVAELRYLLRKNEDVQGEVDLIVTGEGVADLISDLHECARIYAREAANLTGSQLEKSPEKTAAKAKEYASRISSERSHWGTNTQLAEAISRRNRCFALVSEACSEIRAAARFAFRNNRDVLGAFVDKYRAGRNRRSRLRQREIATSEEGLGTTAENREKSAPK